MTDKSLYNALDALPQIRTPDTQVAPTLNPFANGIKGNPAASSLASTLAPATDGNGPSQEGAARSDAAPSLQVAPSPPPHGRRIVCAAIKGINGDVILGIRHYSRDMHRQLDARTDRENFLHRHDPDQGFVDQHGTYLTREEAYEVAKAAGQIVHPDRCGNGLDGPKLYSEGLY